MRLSLTLTVVVMCASNLDAQPSLGSWPQHSKERPTPPVVTPGPSVSVAPPSDAIVLFDGSSLAKWTMRDGSAAKWRVADGMFEVVKGTGTMATRDAFGDAQLHIEWMAPKPAVGTDQDRGNSGVFFGGGRYEVQVLDSYQNVTYAD